MRLFAKKTPAAARRGPFAQQKNQLKRKEWPSCSPPKGNDIMNTEKMQAAKDLQKNKEETQQ